MDEFLQRQGIARKLVTGTTDVLTSQADFDQLVSFMTKNFSIR